MRLYPAPGLTVRDPSTRAVIPAEGVEVGPHDFHLERLRICGDLVDTPPPAPEPEADEPEAAAPAPAAKPLAAAATAAPAPAPAIGAAATAGSV